MHKGIYHASLIFGYQRSVCVFVMCLVLSPSKQGPTQFLSGCDMDASVSCSSYSNRHMGMDMLDGYAPQWSELLWSPGPSQLCFFVVPLFWWMGIAMYP